MNLARLGVCIVSMLVLATSCSSDGEGTGQPTEITNQAPLTTAAVDTSDPADAAQDGQEGAADEPSADDPDQTGADDPVENSGDEEESELDLRPDLLTFPRGALFVSQLGLGSGSSGSALRIIDGDPKILTVSNDGRQPAVLVYSLPVATTFDRFAIPGIVDRPGNVTFFRDIVIEGSNVGPSSGFEVLVEAELTIPSDETAVAELIPEDLVPVRWLRLSLSGGIVIGAGEEGRTNLDFTELIGNGTQDPQPLSTAFDGRWEFRLTERLDVSADTIELHQTGATITGCFGEIDIQGSVNGSIATANGINRDTGQPSAFLFVEDAEGVIQAAASIDGSIFGARTAVEVADLESIRCSEEPPVPVACGSTIYVNFDLDSAVIRPESDQVLTDVYDRLSAEGASSVSIEGHTSTEGSEAYNLDLSERRAQAVVDNIVERGFEAGAIAAAGFGETSPLISPDTDETSRAINRRVEIVCR